MTHHFPNSEELLQPTSPESVATFASSADRRCCTSAAVAVRARPFTDQQTLDHDAASFDVDLDIELNY